jgi:hypothetical protein
MGLIAKIQVCNCIEIEKSLSKKEFSSMLAKKTEFKTQKSSNLKLFVLSFFWIFSLGCDFNKMAEIKAPLKVRIPWKQKGETKYRLQDIELTTVNQLSPLKGSAANLYVKPDILETSISGNPFEIEYTYTSKKVVIPLNRLSAQALTLYAHMERLFLWSQKLNLPPELKQKLDVGLAAEFLLGGVPVRTNAIFSAGINAMLVVPYETEALPLSLNGGVLSHEYFHSLFNGLVLKQIREQEKTKPKEGSELFSVIRVNIDVEKLVSHNGVGALFEGTKPSEYSPNSEKDLQELTYTALLRGMNEGLADVWGWLYSEDTNFIAQSLPVVEKYRDLNFRPNIIWTKAEMRTSISNNAKMAEQAESIAYELGTEYARWFFARIREVEGQVPLSEERRNVWANQIIERLVTYTTNNIDINHPEKMVPSDFITYLVFGNEKLSSDQCEYWMSFINKNERDDAFKRNCR